MNYFEYFKVSIKSILGQWKMLLLSFAVMPLMMIVMLGFFSNQGLDQESLKKVLIKVEDKDNTTLSTELASIFNNDMFEITDDAEYVVTIPNGYEQNMFNNEVTNLNIESQKNRGQTKENIISSYLNAYIKEVSIFLNLSHYEIENKEEIISGLQTIDTSSMIKQIVLEQEHKLGAYEVTTISISGFVIIMILTNLGVGIYQQTGTGIEKRNHTLPLSRNKMLILDFVTYFIMSIIEMIFFIAPLIILNLALGNVILQLIPVILLASILTSSIALMITTIAGKKYGTMVLYGLMYVELFFGGIFANFNIDFVSQMKGYSPGSIISSIIENLLINQNFDGVGHFFVIGIIISIVSILVAYIKNKIEWGKQ